VIGSSSTLLVGDPATRSFLVLASSDTSLVNVRL